MIEKEPMSNIDMVCTKCAEERLKKTQSKIKGKKIKPGMFVKLAFKQGDMVEHMWVRVTSVGTEYTGVVDNIPMFITKPKYKSRVKFKRSEIEDTYDPGKEKE